MTLVGQNSAITTRKRTPIEEWAQSVKLRDGKCLDCGSLEDLHAHHVKPKSTNPELRYDVENGKTLCYRCHKAEHERNRPLRVRGNKPQRRTLYKQIALLEAEVRQLKAALSQAQTDAQIAVATAVRADDVERRRLRGEVRLLSQRVGECQRGSCEGVIARIRAA